MSKLDAQRAMREARYAARQGATSTRNAPVRRPPVAPEPEPRARPAEPRTAASADDACGHRSMNGRTCTRPAGHAEKNHRYS